MAAATVQPAPLPDKKPPAPKQVVTARPAAKAPPKPEAAPAEQAPPTELAPPSAPPRAIPATLVGLSAEDLRAAMGAPVQEIAEAPGVRWRYRGPGCVLDVHLFPRVESQGLYALDVSATGLPVEACLERFRNPPPPPTAAVSAPAAPAAAEPAAAQ